MQYNEYIYKTTQKYLDLYGLTYIVLVHNLADNEMFGLDIFRFEPISMTEIRKIILRKMLNY